MLGAVLIDALYEYKPLMWYRIQSAHTGGSSVLFLMLERMLERGMPVQSKKPCHVPVSDAP